MISFGEIYRILVFEAILLRFMEKSDDFRPGFSLYRIASLMRKNRRFCIYDIPDSIC